MGNRPIEEQHNGASNYPRCSVLLWNQLHCCVCVCVTVTDARCSGHLHSCKCKRLMGRLAWIDAPYVASVSVSSETEQTWKTPLSACLCECSYASQEELHGFTPSDTARLRLQGACVQPSAEEETSTVTESPHEKPLSRRCLSIFFPPRNVRGVKGGERIAILRPCVFKLRYLHSRQVT